MELPNEHVLACTQPGGLERYFLLRMDSNSQDPWDLIGSQGSAPFWLETNPLALTLTQDGCHHRRRNAGQRVKEARRSDRPREPRLRMACPVQTLGQAPHSQRGSGTNGVRFSQ